MSWIAEYDTRGREFPTCVHVTKTTGFMTHGATYVPIEDGKAVRDENARLREVVADGELHAREILAENAKLRNLVKRMHDHIKESCDMCDEYYCSNFDEDNECCVYDTLAREVGIEVSE